MAIRIVFRFWYERYGNEHSQDAYPRAKVHIFLLCEFMGVGLLGCRVWCIYLQQETVNRFIMFHHLLCSGLDNSGSWARRGKRGFPCRDAAAGCGEVSTWVPSLLSLSHTQGPPILPPIPVPVTVTLCGTAQDPILWAQFTVVPTCLGKGRADRCYMKVSPRAVRSQR